MNPRKQLAQLIRDEAGNSAGARRRALEALATRLDALPNNHPTARVLDHLPKRNVQEFPSQSLRALVHDYGGTDAGDEDAFLYDVSLVPPTLELG